MVSSGSLAFMSDTQPLTASIPSLYRERGRGWRREEGREREGEREREGVVARVQRGKEGERERGRGCWSGVCAVLRVNWATCGYYSKPQTKRWQ